MQDVPTYLSYLFGATTLLTIFWFYRACHSRNFLVIALIWIILQSVIAKSGFYQNTNVLPPRILLLGILPVLLLILLLFSNRSGRAFLDQVDLKTLTIFHSIRIPVEIILALLYWSGVMSVYITYEGTNFDLFSGVTAPLVYFLVFGRKNVNRGLLLGWNIICLLLLLNVVITAILSMPSPLQKLAFDQPNIPFLYFPYVLLPTVIVPLVLLAHLITFRQLAKVSGKIRPDDRRP
ncbi:MAG: hypothetical protein IPL46_28355 [Saprospiraceae bacterium]|nr:hypothetical protein [Saprospiraceae bacterium]